MTDLACDVLLLADVFGNAVVKHARFTTSWTPQHYLTNQSLAWDTLLTMMERELYLKSHVDSLRLIKKKGVFAN